MNTPERLKVLHLGDPIKYNPDLYDKLFSNLTVVSPPVEQRRRSEFIRALKDRRWGNFHGLMRPIMFSGTEMGAWDEELISLLPSTVKVFASAGAGYDTIDVATMAKRGIIYCNSAGSGSEAVADAAVFHILSTFRNFSWSQLAARTGDPQIWQHASDEVTHTAHNPRDHTLGIIGLGSIGSLVAMKAGAAFGMKIIYHDVVRKPREQEDTLNARFCHTLEDLLKEADCVVIATPFTGQKLITASELRKMKPGARLVNVARGGLLDEDALADALESRHIFAAGLDVYEHEPHVNPRLLSKDLERYLTLTCHNAGDAVETHVDFERLSIENVARALGGQDPLTAVNLHLMGDRKSD